MATARWREGQRETLDPVTSGMPSDCRGTAEPFSDVAILLVRASKIATRSACLLSRATSGHLWLHASSTRRTGASDEFADLDEREHHEELRNRNACNGG
jgi:hypothetical protein